MKHLIGFFNLLLIALIVMAIFGWSIDIQVGDKNTRFGLSFSKGVDIDTKKTKKGD